MSKSQRMQVKLPPGFDPNRHQAALMKKITDAHGEGFELLSIDPVQGVAYVSRQVAVTEVTASSTSDSFEVLLAHGTKQTDGDKVAAKFMDQYPGYYMTRFEPFLGRATLTRLSDDEARCRGAVAVALGAKPWDVAVKARPDGGFDLGLPNSYQPSKADKLDEVATEVVGRPGWYARIDAQRLTASLIPADPPTFPPAIPTPMKRLGKGDVMATPFGWQLPGPGEKTSPEAVIDWRASGSALVSGLAGGGKAQPLDAPLPVPVSARFPTGRATIGDLDVGDRVFSRDGSVTEVTYLSPVTERRVLALELSDGQVVEADADHLWLVRDRDGLEFDTTGDYQAYAGVLLEVANETLGMAGDAHAIAGCLGVHASDVVRYLNHTMLPEAGRGYGRSLYPVAEVGYGLYQYLVTGETHKVVTSAEIAATLTATDGEPRWVLAASDHPDAPRVPLHVVGVTEVGVKPVRCLAVNHPEHTYLTAGYVTTHNTVTITSILADRVANGAFLAVIDTADKSVDYSAFKDMCGVVGVDGKFVPGWGCDTLGDAVAVLAMLCEEGKKRAKVLADLGINNWLDLPPDKAFRPIFIIADEYEALVARVPEPKALPKDHPIRVEAIEENMAHDLISHYMNRIVKEFRFVGLNPLISTQVSNASTGLPPSLKGKMGHFVLCGSTPSEAARKQSFPDASGVPHVPAHVAAGGAVARGTGAAKIEGGGAFVFKSYFAPVDAYREALLAAGVQTFDVKKVSPTRQQIDRFLPRLDDEDGNREGEQAVRAGGGERGPSGRSAAEIAASMGDRVGVAMHDGSLGTGFEKANAMRHLAGANAGKATGKQKAEAAEEAEYAARSGEVTVRQAPTPPPTTEGDDW